MHYSNITRQAKRDTTPRSNRQLSSLHDNCCCCQQDRLSQPPGRMVYRIRYTVYLWWCKLREKANDNHCSAFECGINPAADLLLDIYAEVGFVIVSLVWGWCFRWSIVICFAVGNHLSGLCFVNFNRFCVCVCIMSDALEITGDILIVRLVYEPQSYLRGRFWLNNSGENETFTAFFSVFELVSLLLNQN